MGKKNKKFEPHVNRSLYVYDTVWWIGFEDETGRPWCYAIPSVNAIRETLSRFDKVYNVRIFSKESVYPFIIH